MLKRILSAVLLVMVAGVVGAADLAVEAEEALPVDFLLPVISYGPVISEEKLMMCEESGEPTRRLVIGTDENLYNVHLPDDVAVEEYTFPDAQVVLTRRSIEVRSALAKTIINYYFDDNNILKGEYEGWTIKNIRVEGFGVTLKGVGPSILNAQSANCSIYSSCQISHGGCGSPLYKTCYPPGWMYMGFCPLCHIQYIGCFPFTMEPFGIWCMGCHTCTYYEPCCP